MKQLLCLILKVEKKLWKPFVKCNPSGPLLITITHDLLEVTQADRVIVMNKGEIWMEGTPRELFTKKKQLIEIGLDTPFVSKLADELKDAGLPLTREPLNHQELLEELWTFHSTR